MFEASASNTILPWKIFSESATNDADGVHDAIPPRVAYPNTVILATAVGTPEPNLTLLQTAAMVADGVAVAEPFTINTLEAVIEATADTVAEPLAVLKASVVMVASGVAVALPSLTLEPLPVVVTVVVDVPLIKAEPSGTRLALADTFATTDAVAEPSRFLRQEAVADDVAVTTVCISP